MRKTYIYIATLIFLAIVLALGSSIFLGSEEDNPTDKTSIETGENTTTKEESTNNLPTSTSENDDTTEEKITGVYADYSTDKLLPNSTNLIFFYAPWCPSCRRLDEDLMASRQDIPPNIQILKADYDSESELKQEYGVTLQHTIVQVDEKGKQIKKIDGYYTIYTLEELVNSI